MDQAIQQFLNGKPFAVVGASTNREKYGNKVLRCYIQNDLDVIPVNPHAERVEDLEAYPRLQSIPQTIHGISVITPPAVTENVVQEAIQLGINNIWMQPGAESDRAIELAQQHGLNLIAQGPCILVVLGYTESPAQSS